MENPTASNFGIKIFSFRTRIFHLKGIQAFVYRLLNCKAFLPVSLQLCLILVLGVGNVLGQQVIGTYPGVNGGYEGATIDNTVFSSAQSGKWVKNNATQTIGSESTTVRSGSTSLSATNGSTGRRIWTPLVTVSSTTSSVTIQYYRRVLSTTNTQESQSAVGNGTTTDASPGSYSVPSSANTWEKVTYTRTSWTFTDIAGAVLTRSIGTGGTIFIDDLVMYNGSVDNTAPNSPGSVTISNATSSSLDISWVAASGGVDGGGYVVVRYSSNPNADNDPNQNGIYAVGNTTTNGTGSLTGTIRYIGTGTSFTDNVGLSSGTQYWYKVYTVDKAFNYSTESSGNGTTTFSTSDPTLNAVTLNSALTTTYGTASSGISFTASGSNLTSNITATAQSGYEVSTSSASGYGASVSVASGTTVYVRMNSTLPAGSYNGATAVVLSGGGASVDANVTTSASLNVVSTKTLTITGLSASNKEYDATTAVTINGTPAFSGLVNSESFPVSGSPTWAFATKTVGTNKTINRTGNYTAPSANYTVTQPTLTATITAKTITVTSAAASNKTYDGTTTATITGTLSGVIAGDVVTLTGTGTFASANVATGISVTSTSTLSGTDAANYSLTQPTGLTANITQATQTIVFGALPAKTTADVPFACGAFSATSGTIALTYISSNTAVATINASGTITIVGVGTTTITVSQAGNANYSAAADVAQSLTVTQAPCISDNFETNSLTNWNNAGGSTGGGTTAVNGGAGDYYLNLNENGEWAQLPTGQTYNSISFNVKGSATSNNWTLKVQTSIDGIIWNDEGGAGTISGSAIGTTYSLQTVNLNPITNYVRLFLVRIGNSCYVGNVEAFCTPAPEINVKQASNNVLSGSGTYSFGTFNTETSSSAILFNIENTGNETLNLTGTPKINISGHTSDFIIDQTLTSGTISSGSSTSFTVSFSPTTSGARSATISLVNNDSNENPYTFTVNGTGVVGTLNSVTLSGPLTTYMGTASAGVSFTASGSNLTGNILVSAQQGYEVSTSLESGYGSSVSVVSGTTVYVRIAATLAIGTYNSAVVAILSSTGALNVNATSSASGNIVRPANDLCSNAVELTLGAAPINGTLTNASITAPFSDYSDVWYSYTAGVNGVVTVNFSGLSTADDFTVYEGCTGTTILAQSSVATFNATSGTVYLIRIRDLVGDAGTFNISLQRNEYRTRASGNWGVNTTWEKWSGSAWINCASGDYPNNSNASVTIRTGHVVDNDGAIGSPWSVFNLTIESGGKVWDNSFAGNNDYIKLFGDVICDGTIGAPNGDDISFEIAGGNNCTISGAGSFTATRIRKSNDINPLLNASLLFDMDVRLTWSSGSGTVLYNASNCNSDGSMFNVTVSSGKTVRCSGPGAVTSSVSIDGLYGSNSDNTGGVYTIYGILDLDGAFYSTTNNSNVAAPTSLVIKSGGIVKCRYLDAAASGVAGNTLRIEDGGKLNIFGSVDTISASLNDITWLNFSATNNTWDFQTGSTIEYSGVTQQRVNGISACINFIVSGGGLKKLGNDFTVAGNLTLTSGRVQTDAYRLIHTSTNASSLIHSTGSASFVFGTYRRYIASNTSVYELPVGLSSATSGYRRADLVNNNLSGVTYVDASVGSLSESGNNIDSRIACSQNGTALTDVLGSTIWSLVPSVQPSSGSYGVRLYVSGTGLSAADDNTFCPVKRTSGSTDYADWNTFETSTSIPSSGTAGRIYASGNGYAERNGYTSFSEHAIGKAPSNQPLPVELYSFTANCLGEDNVKLMWVTASENNSSHFVIENSVNGVDWNVAGIVNAAGTSQETLEYEFAFRTHSSLNYVRLKQVDKDGEEVIYPEISVVCSSNYNTLVTIPNPSGNEFTAVFDSEINDSSIEIQLTDIQGRDIFSKRFNVSKGLNFIALEGQTWPAGVYYLKVTAADGKVQLIRHRIL